MGSTQKKKSPRSPRSVAKSDSLPLSVRTFIAIVVTVVWAGSIIADFISPQFAVSPMIHTVMAAVIGVDVGEALLNRLSGRK